MKNETDKNNNVESLKKSSEKIEIESNSADLNSFCDDNISVEVEIKPSLINFKSQKISSVLFWILQIFTLLTIVGSILLYFLRGRINLELTMTQIFMGVMSLIIFNFPRFLQKRFKLYVPPFLSIFLYLLLFSHFVLGEIYRVYDRSLLFDKILHTGSGVAISLLSFTLVSSLNNLPKNNFKLSPFFVVLFSFCFTMTCEYLWEIFEFFMDSVFGQNMQRWNDSLVNGSAGIVAGDSGEFVHNIARGNGLKDSMTDMIVNVFGCLGVCIYAYIGMKLKPNWFTGKIIQPIDQAIEGLKQNNGENVEKILDDTNFKGDAKNIKSISIAEGSLSNTEIVSISKGETQSTQIIKNKNPIVPDEISLGGFKIKKEPKINKPIIKQDSSKINEGANKSNKDLEKANSESKEKAETNTELKK